MGIFSKRDKTMPAMDFSAAPTTAAAPPEHTTRTEIVKVNLRKGGVGGARARIVFVLDKSGSMHHLFENGTVKRVLERLVAVADVMDDNHTMEVFAFATTASRLPDVTVGSAATYFNDPRVIETMKQLGHDNVEPLVMKLVMDEYLVTNPSDLATFVVFFSDGGIGLTGPGYRGNVNQDIEDLIIESSHHKLFWQFAGLGRANFGKLEQLDTLDGGFVDNAGFFQIDNIDQLSDEDLFRLLLTEFPKWLQAARAKGMHIAV